MRSPLPVLALCAAVAVLPPAARATQAPMVHVRFSSQPLAAAAGVRYEGSFEIVAVAGGEVTQLRMEGVGWAGLQLDPQGPVRLTPDQVYPVEFMGTPSDPNQPLWVVFLYDGREVRRKFDLSPAAIAALGRPEEIVRIADRSGDPAPAPGLGAGSDEQVLVNSGAVGPVAARPRRPGEKPRNESPLSVSSTAGHWVTVFGRFVFFDSTNVQTGAHGVTVRIYDEEDLAADDLLGYTVTDWNGYWSATVWADEGAPDIYMEFEAANTVAEMEHDSVLEENWVWTSGIHEDFGGSSLNHGISAPGNADRNPIFYILNNLTRTWLWLNAPAVGGYNTPSVDCQYPTDAGNSFNNGDIHIIPRHRWMAGTHVHEYGHTWLHYYAVSPAPDYCNGICDGGGCPGGHCAWCQENGSIGWTEGMPDWLADVVIRHIKSAYGATLYGDRNHETTKCVDSNNMPCACTPSMTEGFVAALLRDIEDPSLGDIDPNALAGGVDALALGADEILWLTNQVEPGTVTDFINAFKATYPNSCEGFWATTRNNGFAVGDNSPPGSATNLACTDHSVGYAYSSPDATLSFTWTRAPDDCSGIAGYAVTLTQNAPALPGQYVVIGDVTSYTSLNLPPGAYWFNLRAKDRSGKWSATYANLGPIVVRDPYPADLAVQERAGWDYPLVPRADESATISSVPAPAQLHGNSNTWYSLNVANVGELLNENQFFRLRVFVDGDSAHGLLGAAWLDPLEEFPLVNMGPITVRGGRHTFEAFADADEAWAEHFENNNRWALQWAWNPLPMSVLAPLVRPAPPDRTGGWAWVPNPDFPGPNQHIWDNCDGLRIPSERALSGPAWRAIAIHALDDGDDYNADLHYPAAFAYARNGFSQPLLRSLRGAGSLDAVLVNDFRTSQDIWDVGVVNQSGGTSSYAAGYRRSSELSLPDSISVSLAQDEMFRLWHFWLPPLQGGPTTVKIVSDSIAGLHVAWFNSAATRATLGLADAETVTGGFGQATLQFYAGGGPDPHGLMVYRDPSSGRGPVSFGLKVTSSLHDYVVGDPPSGWDAALVPSPTDDGTPDMVRRPVALAGDEASTYLNLAFQNAGYAPGPDVGVEVCVDDSAVASLAYPGPPPGSYVTANEGIPVPVPAGRHTLQLRVDPADQIGEFAEGNNAYAEQYVWAATSPMNYAVPVRRPLPNDPCAGWGEIPPSEEPLWLNVDGLRSPPFDFIRTGDPLWGGIAMMPDPGFDADLRLFEVSTGAKEGFDSTLARSGSGVGLPEFVLANFSRTPRRSFDIGVEYAGSLGADGAAAGGGAYTAVAVRSEFLGDNPEGTFGPYEMFPDQMLHLYSLTLWSYRYRFRLGHAGGMVDWGFSLHGPGEAFYSKNLALASAWSQDPGLGEEFVTDIPAPGNYCLAVWKRRSADLALEGGYTLEARPENLSVPGGDSAPRTALAGVHPHPLRPGATLAFDLASAGHALLEVFDVRGARVRVLAEGPQRAGRTTLSWNGLGQDGQRLPSGVYVVRLRSGGVDDSRKVVVME